MHGSFSFEIDPTRCLLRIVFHGFFRLEDLAGYVPAKAEALRRLGCPPNEHRTLCDFSACTPQSQAVIDLFRASLEDSSARSRRLAVVVGSTLASLQAKRSVTRSDAAFFFSAADAEQWLFDDPLETAEPAIEFSSSNA